MSEPRDEMNEVDDEEPVIVTLTDEDGEEQTFQLVRVLEVGGREYGLLASLDDEEPSSNGTGELDDEDAGHLIVLRLAEEGGEEYFEEIEDEDEFQSVVEVLEKLTAEET